MHRGRSFPMSEQNWGAGVVEDGAGWRVACWRKSALSSWCQGGSEPITRGWFRLFWRTQFRTGDPHKQWGHQGSSWWSMQVLAPDFHKLTEKIKFPIRSLPYLGPGKPDAHLFGMQAGERVISRKYNYLDFQGSLTLFPAAEYQLTHNRGKGERDKLCAAPSHMLGTLYPLPHLQTVRLTLQDGCSQRSPLAFLMTQKSEAKPC